MKAISQSNAIATLVIIDGELVWRKVCIDGKPYSRCLVAYAGIVMGISLIFQGVQNLSWLWLGPLFMAIGIYGLIRQNKEHMIFNILPTYSQETAESLTVTSVRQAPHSFNLDKKPGNLLEGILDQAPLVILHVDSKGKILLMNPFGRRVCGLKEDQLNDLCLWDLFDSDVAQSWKNDLIDILQGKNVCEMERTISDRNNEKIVLSWRCLPIMDPIGKDHSILLIGEDLTPAQKMRCHLEHLAYNDPLTHLPNRTAFIRRGEEALNKNQEAEHQIAFIFMDVDNFKNINDAFGNAAGDRLLMDIARGLKWNLPQDSFFARLGGDGFGMIFDPCQSRQDLEKSISRLLRYFERAWRYKEYMFFVTVSMGIAMWPEDGSTVSMLMQNADVALNQAKDGGRDRVAYYHRSMKERTWHHIYMHNLLRESIHSQRFELHYQAQISLQDNSLIGLEALVRIKEADGQYIMPLNFIPFAEANGYIHQITQWVLRQACLQIKIWQKQGYDHIKVSVNLSGQSLAMPLLVEDMMEILNENNVSPQNIEFEITETAVIDNISQSREVIKELKKLGFGIALDDFGAGHSSLMYLHKLPIDLLKLDRSFITHVKEDTTEAYIIDTIVALAHKLGLKVLAEGVETKDQAMFLKERGIDFAQGFFFSRPGSPNMMKHWLARGRDQKGQLA